MFKSIRIWLSAFLFLMVPIVIDANTCINNMTLATAHLIDNADGTVTDLKTGLMWKKCSEGQIEDDCSGGNAQVYNWMEALEKVQLVNVGGGFVGYMDWRLPNIKELTSIVEEACYNPSINIEVFPNTPSSAWFWSSSPYINDDSRAWFVDFGYGGYDSFDSKNNNHLIRLVR